MTLKVSSGMAVPSGMVGDPPFAVHLGQRDRNVLGGALGQLRGDAVGVHRVGDVQLVVEDVFDAGGHHRGRPEDERPAGRVSR